MFSLTRKDAGDVTVVAVTGKLIGGPENSALFHDMFKGAIEDGRRKFVVDLAGAEWANSQGIGMLIGAYTSTSNAEGSLVLANTTERIQDILDVTRLNLIFKSFDSEEEASAFVDQS
jgi:anti-sigma B factor antagonist